MTDPRPPNEITSHIGSRLRYGRTILGLNQTQLAAHIGVTYQQIQKYETGKNRIPSNHLYEFAVLFDVSPDWFFPDPERPPDNMPSDYLALVREIAQIPADRRQSVIDLCRSVARLHKNQTPTT